VPFGPSSPPRTSLPPTRPPCRELTLQNEYLRLEIGNQIPVRQATGEPDPTRDLPEGEPTVKCERFLGGLLNSHYRKAA